MVGTWGQGWGSCGGNRVGSYVMGTRVRVGDTLLGTWGQNGGHHEACGTLRGVVVGTRAQSV